MPRLVLSFAILAALPTLAATFGSAQEPPAPGKGFVADVKAAAALVDINDRNQATAFCVHESGLYVTNVGPLGQATSVRLIFRPGQSDETALSASVIRQDKTVGLALLKAEGKFNHKPLPLGHDESLVELAEVVRVGFPAMDRSAEKSKSNANATKRDYPPLRFDTGRIASLKRQNGELESIQTNMPSKGGTFGGPLLDAVGNVIGVLNSSGDEKSSVAIPVNRLRRFANRPDVESSPPLVAYTDRFKRATFKVKAAAPLPNRDPYQVNLIIVPKQGPERLYRMKFDKGVYQADAEMLIAPPADAPVSITLEYPSGLVKGTIADRSMTVGQRAVRLSAISRIAFGQEPLVVLNDGVPVKGAIGGLDEVDISLGADTVKVNPVKAMALTVVPLPPETGIDYRIVVQSAGKELAVAHNHLRFGGVPLAKTPPPANLNGLWLLERESSSGKKPWPKGADEALYIEGKQVLWVTKDGKIPFNAAESLLTIDASKTPGILQFATIRGAFKGNWSAIYRFENGSLTIATNLTAEPPGDFTTDVEHGGASYVRTYQKSKSERP